MSTPAAPKKEEAGLTDAFSALGPIESKDFESLAPVPQSLAYLAKVQYEPEIGFQEVSRVIETDMALVANLLRLANSAWSRGASQIMTVKDALNRLGMTNIVNLVLMSSLASAMKKACPGYDLGENELARHSVAAYLAASSLRRFSPVDLPNGLSTAALLHDIGKLLLERYISQTLLAKIRQSVADKQFPTYCQAEEHFIGANHAEVGMAIAHFWKFPRELFVAIRRHHEPEVYDDLLLAGVKLADLVAKMVFPLRVSEEMPRKEQLELMHVLGIVPSDLALMCVLVEEEWKETEKLLQM